MVFSICKCKFMVFGFHHYARSLTKDNQSNFGTGYGYQYGSQEGIIEINMNENGGFLQQKKSWPVVNL